VIDSVSRVTHFTDPIRYLHTFPEHPAGEERHPSFVILASQLLTNIAIAAANRRDKWPQSAVFYVFFTAKEGVIEAARAS
jgi:hypothetical protein